MPYKPPSSTLHSRAKRQTTHRQHYQVVAKLHNAILLSLFFRKLKLSDIKKKKINHTIRFSTRTILSVPCGRSFWHTNSRTWTHVFPLPQAGTRSQEQGGLGWKFNCLTQTHTHQLTLITKVLTGVLAPWDLHVKCSVTGEVILALPEIDHYRCTNTSEIWTFRCNEERKHK